MQMFTSCVKVATTCRSKLFKGTHLFSPIDSWNLLAISGLGTVRLYTVIYTPLEPNFELNELRKKAIENNRGLFLENFHLVGFFLLGGLLSLPRRKNPLIDAVDNL